MYNNCLLQVFSTQTGMLFCVLPVPESWDWAGTKPDAMKTHARLLDGCERCAGTGDLLKGCTLANSTLYGIKAAYFHTVHGRGRRVTRTGTEKLSSRGIQQQAVQK